MSRAKKRLFVLWMRFLEKAFGAGGRDANFPGMTDEDSWFI
jgi:hypothetical protein